MKYTNVGFEKKVQEIKNEYRKLNHDAVYYELTILVPAMNMFVNGVHGVLFAPNYFSAISSMRIMFEAIGALSYFEKNDPSNEEFNDFLRKRRIYKSVNETINIDGDTRDYFLDILCFLKEHNPDNKYFINLSNDVFRLIKKGNSKLAVSIRKQLDNIDKITQYSDAKRFYDEMCKYVHFGSAQIMGAVCKIEPLADKAMIKWRVGPKTLTREDRAIMRNIVSDSQKIMVEVIRYSAEYNDMHTNRFNYKPDDGAGIIPKEYRDVVETVLKKNTVI